MIDIADFLHAKRLLLELAGIDLNMSKQQMVFNRLMKPMRLLNYGSIADFLSDAESKADIRQLFLNALTTNVTSFFREPHHFPAIVSHASKKLSQLKIWSAGCSTGQEPYSILIALLEQYPQLAHNKTPIILATDIDTQALAHAQQGVYTDSDLTSIDSEQTKKYFDRLSDGCFQVKPQFKHLIEFKPLNLAGQWVAPWKGLDIILCRNVMIYFSAETQQVLVGKFAALLKPDGLLISGHSEMLLHSDTLLHSVGRTVYALRKAVA